MAKRSQRFDAWETALIAVLAVVGTLALAPVHVAPAPGAELEWLVDTYGPSKHSQYVEEWIIRDYFRGLRRGVFVDVGAAHYKTFSNTYFLEREWGWSGLAVEPQEVFAEDYARFRPRTRFRRFFVSDRSNEDARLFVNQSPWVASSNRGFTERWGKASEIKKVPTITLNDLLHAEQIDAADFVSMDIELSEPKALAGFDIRRFGPALVCIEAHPEVRQDILDYFHSSGYVVVGKYLRMDDKNLYFMPAGTKIRPLPPAVLDAAAEKQ